MTALLLLATGLAGAAEIPMDAAQRERLDITTAAVEVAHDVTGQALPAHVVIPPEGVAVVATPQTGLVSAVRVAVGDEVDAGDPLAELQSPDLVALQSAFLQAASRARVARKQYERDRTLFEEGVIAERRYLDAENAWIEARAAVDERRQALLIAGMSQQAVDDLEENRTLSRSLTIRAPRAGTVLERMVEPGERIQASHPLYRIGDLSTLWIEVRAPLDMAERHAIGDRVAVRGTGIEARLITIGREVDPQNQTVLLRAEITAGADELRPGQFLEVAMGRAVDGTPHYRVPASAVVRSGDRATVFVAGPDGFRAVDVRVVSEEDRFTVIGGPLQDGDRVAATGLAAIKGAWQGLGVGE